MFQRTWKYTSPPESAHTLLQTDLVWSWSISNLVPVDSIHKKKKKTWGLLPKLCQVRLQKQMWISSPAAGLVLDALTVLLHSISQWKKLTQPTGSSLRLFQRTCTCKAPLLCAPIWLSTFLIPSIVGIATPWTCSDPAWTINTTKNQGNY